MADYSAYVAKFADRAKNWGASLRSWVVQVGSDLAGKADADHSHGAGGEVVGIGLSTNRPAVSDGYIHSETDTDQLAVLNADASLRYRVPCSDEVALMAMILGG